jgi:RNA polymerase sigma factor (sigma-70 family)
MNSTPETRYSLIARLCNAGDVIAWSEFTTIYQPIVHRICLQKGLQHADAIDVTQEVLAKVASAVGKFDGNREGSTFRGWLYRVTRNMIADFFRSRNRNPLVNAQSWPETEIQHVNEDDGSIFQLEFKRQIFWLVAQEIREQVHAQSWQAFWATEVEQRPVEEVAQELNLKRGSVYMARSRIFARLRHAVDQILKETSHFHELGDF